MAQSNFEQSAAVFVDSFQRIHKEISKVIVGHHRLIEDVLTALFAGGHVLLEGVPGIGKTILVSTLANSVDCVFSRIQFTPDLMPSDIIGTRVVVEDEDAVLVEGLQHPEGKCGGANAASRQGESDGIEHARTRCRAVEREGRAF